MATQRTNSALLITFIVLFVFASVGFTIIMMELNSTKKALVDQKAKTDQAQKALLASNEDMEKFKALVGSSMEGLTTKNPTDNKSKLELLSEGITTATIDPLKLIDLAFELKKQRDTTASALKTAQDALTDAESKYKNNLALLDDQITEKNKDFEKVKAQFEADTASEAEAAKKAKADAENARTFLANAQADHRKQIGDRDVEIARHKSQIVNLENQIKILTGGRDLTGAVTPVALDLERSVGEVLISDPQIGVAINLGSKDGVKPGLKFAVYTVRADGSRIKGGDLQIKEVLPQVSHGVLIGVEDPSDVVHKGDILINPAFKPGQAKVFVADTIFDKAKKQTFRDELDQYGSVLEDDVTARTDYVIVNGQSDAAKSKILQDAKRLGIAVIDESDLNHFIQK